MLRNGVDKATAIVLLDNLVNSREAILREVKIPEICSDRLTIKKQGINPTFTYRFLESTTVFLSSSLRN